MVKSTNSTASNPATAQRDTNGSMASSSATTQRDTNGSSTNSSTTSNSSSSHYPYERQAASGRPAPDGLSLSDITAYQALRTLYQRYYDKRISLADASREKQAILAAWRKEREIEQFRAGLAETRQKQIKQFEVAMSGFAKNPTLEGAMALHEALYGCRPKQKDSERLAEKPDIPKVQRLVEKPDIPKARYNHIGPQDLTSEV